MKNKLLQAMESLPMLAKDKEKFANIIIDKFNSGGGSKLGHLYFKNGLKDNGLPIVYIFGYLGEELFRPMAKTKELGVVPLSSIPKGCGYDPNVTIEAICIEDHVLYLQAIPFYDAVELFKDDIIGYDESTIEALKANEISEEEFLKGIEFGLPEE